MLFFILLFILVAPLLEIAVFIDVGGAIGVLPTVLLTLLTASIGITLIRSQGFSTATNIRAQMEKNEFPFEGIFEGFMVLTAGIMLLIPGFVTDGVGLLLFIPWVRKLLYKMTASSHKDVMREDYSSSSLFEESHKHSQKTIDAEYKDTTKETKDE